MKRICLLACLGMACSAGNPLAPAEPGPDASVSPDATEPLPEKPSFTVTTPIEGQIFREPAVEVRGTALHLDVIAIDGASVPVIDGAFSHVVLLDGEGAHQITVAAPDAGELRIGVLLDLAPPEIEILSPDRGAFFDARETSAIRVEGRVSDAVSPIEEVRVNGAPVALAGDRFTVDLTAEPGVNLIEVIAFDAAGRSADVLQGAIFGEYAPWDTVHRDAISIGLRADAFDVFEEQLELGLAAGLSTAASAQQDGSFTIETITFSAIDVEIVPRAGFLELSVAIEELAIGFAIDTVVLGSPVRTTGAITADRVDAGTELRAVAGPNGELELDTEGSTAALTNFAITAQNLSPFLTNALAGYLEPQLELAFVEALESQDLSGLLDFSRLLPENTAIEITSIAFAPEGMTVLADAAIALPPAPAALTAPAARAPPNVPPASPPSARMVRTSLSDDLLNGTLFHTWRSGALTSSIAIEQLPGQIALDAATFALFFGDDLFDYAPPATPVALRVRPLLPPVARIEEGTPAELQLTIADALLDFELAPEGEEPIRFATFALAIEATAILRLEDGALAPPRTAIRIDLADAPLFPIDEDSLENLISSLLFATGLANPIGSIPIDTAALRNVAFTGEADYLSILGDL